MAPRPEAPAIVSCLRRSSTDLTPAVCHTIGYWVIGLPLGYWLCFQAGFGATGLWMGLCAALVAIGVVLGAVWHRKRRALERTMAAASSS